MKTITVDTTKYDAGAVGEAAAVLKRGGIVAIPTETVYGLAAASRNRQAIDRLYSLKKRDRAKPLTLCFADSSRAQEYFSILPPFGYRMIESYWPGPLTVIFYAINSEETIGIRVTSHPVAAAVLCELNSPVYLPSANISGEKEAVSAEEVVRVFGEAVDLVLDAGPSPLSQPSTVVDLTQHPFHIRRQGVVSYRDLMGTFFRKKIVFVCSGNTCRSPMAEYLLRHTFQEKFPYLLDRYDISSRGTIPLLRQPATSEVKDLLGQDNINIQSHRSERIDRSTILSSDLIFVMEPGHKEQLVRMEPTAESRIFLLSKFLSSHQDDGIRDPIGKSKEVYREVYVTIKDALGELIEWLA